MRKIIVHEFQVVPNIFGFLPRGKYRLPAIILPETFKRVSITDNYMDSFFEPCMELNMAISCTGLHIFDEDAGTICINLN